MFLVRLGAALVCVLHSFEPSLSSGPEVTPSPPAECPWFTEGSATHALGGEVLATVTLRSSTEGVCDFVLRRPPGKEIKIYVGGNDHPSCARGSKAVVGVGTHASQCSLSNSQRELQQMVSGAVREKSFAIVVTTAAVPAAQSTEALEILRQVAETVAGNLF